MPIIRMSATEARRRAKKKPTDWDRVDAMTDQDIDRQIAEDPDVAPDMSERIARGEGRVVYPPGYIHVGKIREALGLSQSQFASRFNFSLRTVQEWEQGRRRPTGPARVLLQLIERIPDQVTKALEEERA